MARSVSLTGDLKLKQQLNALKLDKKKRRWINRTLGRKVVSWSKKRIRDQKDVDGRSFAKRRDGSRRKMERGLARKMALIASSDKATVTWRNNLTAKIAFAQQHGIDQVVTASQMKKWHGDGDQKPASRRQAKKLLRAGYKIRRGKGWKRPTIKYITDNLSRKQAGVILRSMGYESTSKKRWKLKGTERAFLGVNKNEVQELLNITAQQIIKLT